MIQLFVSSAPRHVNLPQLKAAVRATNVSYENDVAMFLCMQIVQGDAGAVLTGASQAIRCW